MPTINEDRMYESVLRMVVWGESKQDVFQRLTINGYEGEIAQRLYARACAERVASIRMTSLKKLGLGLALIVAGIAVLAGFWFGFGGITRYLLLLTLGAVAFGLWRFIDGLCGIMLARQKKGSQADTE